MPPLHRPVIRHDRWRDRFDDSMRGVTRWLIIANIVVGLFTVFNLVIYPNYIYEPPAPVLISEPADQLWPNEV